MGGQLSGVGAIYRSDKGTLSLRGSFFSQLYGKYRSITIRFSYSHPV